MKKTLRLAAAFMMLLMVMTLSPACLADSMLVGDVNLDGKITGTDQKQLNEHIVELRTLTGQSLRNADINGDGNISTTDVAQLNRMLLSDVSFPVGGMISFCYNLNWYTLSYEAVQYGATSQTYTIGNDVAQGKVLIMPAHSSGMYITLYAESGPLDLYFFGYGGEFLWTDNLSAEVSSRHMKQFYAGSDVWFILVAGRFASSRFWYQDAYPVF